MFDGMKELIITLAAWGKMAKEVDTLLQSKETGEHLMGLFIGSLMKQCWEEAESEFDKEEKKLMKQVKKEAKQ